MCLQVVNKRSLSLSLYLLQIYFADKLTGTAHMNKNIPQNSNNLHNSLPLLFNGHFPDGSGLAGSRTSQTGLYWS